MYHPTCGTATAAPGGDCLCLQLQILRNPPGSEQAGAIAPYSKEQPPGEPRGVLVTGGWERLVITFGFVLGDLWKV